jgi:hypothetical protein
MTVTLSGDRIRISGAGRVEDAETLVALLQADRSRVVDLAEAAVLHTAIVQALLAFRPDFHGLSNDPFFNTWLSPGLTGALLGRAFVNSTTVVAELGVINAEGDMTAKPVEQT